MIILITARLACLIAVIAAKKTWLRITCGILWSIIGFILYMWLIGM